MKSECFLLSGMMTNVKWSEYFSLYFISSFFCAVKNSIKLLFNMFSVLLFRGQMVMSAIPARQNVGQTTVNGFVGRMVR